MVGNSSHLRPSKRILIETMQKPLIIANWKMNPGTARAAIDLATGVSQQISKSKAQVVICAPYVYLPQLYSLNLKNIVLGAQDAFWAEQGAYTGEISPKMLKNLGVKYVILGHSERKRYLSETPEMINRKIHHVLKARLTPVICIGEKKKQKKQTGKEIKDQMVRMLVGTEKEDVSRLVLVYEPEWAISTNEGAVEATPEDCAASIAMMKEIADEMFGREAATGIRYLYGGSTDKNNIANMLTNGAAQGALVGGSSLKVTDFVALITKATMK